LTGFEFGFEFFPILKNEVGAGIEDINTHPEPALIMSNYILSFLNWKFLNKL
jgi:hypothetical protein